MYDDIWPSMASLWNARALLASIHPSWFFEKGSHWENSRILGQWHQRYHHKAMRPFTSCKKILFVENAHKRDTLFYRNDIKINEFGANLTRKLFALSITCKIVAYHSNFSIGEIKVLFDGSPQFQSRCSRYSLYILILTHLFTEQQQSCRNTNI